MTAASALLAAETHARDRRHEPRVVGVADDIQTRRRQERDAACEQITIGKADCSSASVRVEPWLIAVARSSRSRNTFALRTGTGAKGVGCPRSTWGSR